MRFYILLIFFSVLPFLGFAQQNNTPRPRIGLVLSGGGAKGIAHIGVIKVLEEAGIPVDYIGGTSMGSIIGGLYAIGYSSDELSHLVVTMNWDSLLSDQVDRHILSFEEKEDNARYFVSFPIKEKRIGLPSGAIAGQNIYGMFNKLASPVYREKDFSKFPIPFLCVATDIEKAEATVLRSGYLPQAMRASMAIPSVFTPEIIDDNIYVDGGVLNNFPVMEVKKMGADIIIGVDVGFRPQSRKTLNTIPGIVNQSLYTFTKVEMDKNRKACDVLIEPILDNYNVMSYDAADSLIARGEAAARLMFPQLKALADSLRQFQPLAPRNTSFERFTSIKVKEIELTGLKNVPRDVILRKLQIDVPSEISLNDLEKRISQVFGTLFFYRITYRLEPLDDGARIIIEVEEKNTNYFKVGIHYDTNFKTAVLLNGTFRNLIAPGSKLSLDLALGENVAFNGLLYLNTGWNPEKVKPKTNQLFPDFGIRVSSHNMEVFEYEKDRATASFDFFDYTMDFFWQWNLSNNNAIGGGVMGDYAKIGNRIGTATFPISDYIFSNFHIFYKIDSYDRSIYPTRGVQLVSNLSYVKGLSDDISSETGFFQGSIRYSHAVILSQKLTLTSSLFAGYSLADSVPAHYNYFLGGLGGTYMRGIVSVVGLKYMQLLGSKAWSAGTELRYEAWGNNFFAIKANIAKTTFTGKELIQPDGITFGGGISYGYRSVIGPIEITLMRSNSIRGLAGFINIGYWF
jgi:NTE family protein